MTRESPPGAWVDALADASARVSAGGLEGEADLALVALHDRHVGALHHWARRRFTDPREAEEVVQDTLVLAWRKRDQYDPERGSERAWLFGILRNVASSRHRSNERRLRVVRAARDDESVGSRSDEEDRELDAAAVAEALQSLSADHQAVIVRAYYQGQRLGTIAEALGIPEGTVKSRLYYGLRSLRAELEERGVLS